MTGHRLSFQSSLATTTATALLMLNAGDLLAQDAQPATGQGATARQPVQQPRQAQQGRVWTPPGSPARTKEELAEALAIGVQRLLALQESEAEGGPKSQWPYEGVYRVKGQIPVAYRIGGTALVVMALAQAPGYEEDEARQEAIARAITYICDAKDHPLMSSTDYDAGYDVRAWGYIETIACFCRLRTLNRVPAGQEAAVDAAIKQSIESLQRVEMPETGGWNYARPPGIKTVGAPSGFMTAPALMALFDAKAQGFDVDAGVVSRALGFLEKTRFASGAVVYSGEATARGESAISNATPGAVGRMCSVESALLLAGRSTPAQARAAVDAFIVHWGWLDQRRAQTGTHIGPYAIAPYYFMFAHQAAAQAVELLPKAERAEYRRRINELLFSVRTEDGRWNDRVFERSSGYGTAMAMLAIMQPEIEAARWTLADKADGGVP